MGGNCPASPARGIEPGKLQGFTEEVRSEVLPRRSRYDTRQQWWIVVEDEIKGKA